jgi:protein tyrosine/serine phosphatase
VQTESSLIEPEGIHNFRELSGYQLRPGGVIRSAMIFRSGALELMTERDRAWLDSEIRLRRILDLRHPDELAMRSGSHALADRVIALSVFSETQTQESLIAELNGLYGNGPSPRRYLHYLDIGGERLTQGFQLFADEENYPILVHCTAGKDRTGVLLGMLMDVLGASDEDIAHEYGLSDASIDRLIAYLRSSGRALEGTDDEIRARLSTPPERMAGFIELMREKHGSSEAFFIRHGATPAQVQKVRDLLTA